MNHPMSHASIDFDAPLPIAGQDRLTMLRALERRILWLSTWMIHHANHIRPNVDGLKVGGHQASSASVATLMTALYMDVLRPSDRVAVKPHASPVFHAIQYLLGRQTREKLERFRAFGGVQSYPSRTKDTDDVDISTGSVGLGVAMTTFAALVQDYLEAHEWLGAGRTARKDGGDRRGRGARRGQRVRGAPRRVEARRARSVVGDRLQPPESRRGDQRSVVRPLQSPVRQHGMGRRHHQVRQEAARGVRAPGRRGASPVDRCVSELVVLGARGQGRSGVARALARRHRCAARREGAGLGVRRRTHWAR